MRVEPSGPMSQPQAVANQAWEEPVSEAKPFNIPKQLVWKAYPEVKANRGAAGVDKQSLAAFEANLEDNLYKIWNRMASGSYFPPPVRLVEIAKGDGGKRTLGIPTVGDRIAQMVVKMVLEAQVEPKFHRDSYGYRPHRSALRAVGVARQRCFEFDWVIDLDIQAFFDSLDHELVEKAVAANTDNPWVRLYIARWLRAAGSWPDGSIQPRTRGTPQGGVISPLLANLFLPYALDLWMGGSYPTLRFERYADDVIVHCRSHGEAQAVLKAIGERLGQCGLELHPTKTRIVYCKDYRRRGKHEHISFDFLGYTFRPRQAKGRWGKNFTGFLPAISGKAAKAIRARMRQWRIRSSNTHQRLADIAWLVNPSMRGWLNYYGRFYRSAGVQLLRRYFNQSLTAWARRKFKRLRGRKLASMRWLARIERRDHKLFALWELAPQPQGWLIRAG
jgi:RNA-directed DNA polymerase